MHKRGRVPDLDEALQATAAVVEAAEKQMKNAHTAFCSERKERSLEEHSDQTDPEFSFVHSVTLAQGQS